ncbi:RNI-like protein [Piromyces finnis]|uniref:RNI-like protein n=1 Tax=Piromyces finnis TaxID=1754191 RepID=A0A1Y1VJ82_9FUNG|nr:RNI-like protein [Piromyces finnis]|eukprot:ORX57769.1 RNI-like protein [Piromyces finnis]
MNNKKSSYQICIIALKKVPSSDKYYNLFKKQIDEYKSKRKSENVLFKNNTKRIKSNGVNSLNSTNSTNVIIKTRPILPYEVLAKVYRQLSYKDLYNCMITCKRWYECIINNKSLWRDICLSNCRHFYTLNTIQLIAKRSQNMLRTLDLSNCPEISDNALRPLLLYRCNGIETFRLSFNTRVTYNGIIKLLKIIGLNLTSLSLQKTQVNDRVIEHIFMNCPKLEYLDLSDCINISSDCFMSVYNRNKKIYPMKGLRFQNLSTIINKTIGTCTELFPLLEILDLNNCGNITKSVLLAVGSFTELKELNLSGTSMNIPVHISLEDHFLYLFEKCQKIENISFIRFPILTDVCIDIMCGFCSNLRKINISHSVNITDRSLDLLSNALKYTLSSINISSCPQITNEGLLFVFNRCEKLEEIDISNNSNITDYLFRLYDNPKLPIININVSNCESITGNGIILFIEKVLDTLNFIRIDYCRISNSTLNFIYRRFPNIKFSAKLEKL